MKKSMKRRIVFLLIAAIVLVGCSTDIVTGEKQRHKPFRCNGKMAC